MSSPQALIAEAAAAGVAIYRVGGQLRLRAPGPPDDDLRRRLREAAADLLPLVPEELPQPPPAPSDPEVRWRAEVMRQQLPPFPRPAPLLVARDVPYEPGHCLSCGDPLPAGRCRACRAAVALVLAEWQGGQP